MGDRIDRSGGRVLGPIKRRVAKTATSAADHQSSAAAAVVLRSRGRRAAARARRSSRNRDEDHEQALRIAPPEPPRGADVQPRSTCSKRELGGDDRRPRRRAWRRPSVTDEMRAAGGRGRRRGVRPSSGKPEVEVSPDATRHPRISRAPDGGPRVDGRNAGGRWTRCAARSFPPRWGKRRSQGQCLRPQQPQDRDSTGGVGGSPALRVRVRAGDAFHPAAGHPSGRS